jgi:hypothetical protein
VARRAIQTARLHTEPDQATPVRYGVGGKDD